MSGKERGTHVASRISAAKLLMLLLLLSMDVLMQVVEVQRTRLVAAANVPFEQMQGRLVRLVPSTETNNIVSIHIYHVSGTVRLS